MRWMAAASGLSTFLLFYFYPKLQPCYMATFRCSEALNIRRTPSNYCQLYGGARQ